MPWRTGTGDAILIRQARRDDLGRLGAFADRCSAETLYRRFHGAAEHAVRRELERVAAPTALHRSWVATGIDDGAVHGVATLAWSLNGLPEAAFLVEDAWFRRGIGRRLFAALATEAAAADLDAVLATIQADNRRAVRFLTAIAPHVRMAFADGMLEATIPVTPRSHHRPPAVLGARATLPG